MAIHEQRNLVPQIVSVNYKGQDVEISVAEYNIMAKHRFITINPLGKHIVNEDKFVTLRGEDPYKELR